MTVSADQMRPGWTMTETQYQQLRQAVREDYYVKRPGLMTISIEVDSQRLCAIYFGKGIGRVKRTNIRSFQKRITEILKYLSDVITVVDMIGKRIFTSSKAVAKKVENLNETFTIHMVGPDRNWTDPVKQIIATIHEVYDQHIETKSKGSFCPMM